MRQRLLTIAILTAAVLVLGAVEVGTVLVASHPAHASLQYITQMVVDSTQTLDPTGKYQRVYVDPSSSLSQPSAQAGAVVLDDTARTTAGASITGTLAHSTGHLVWVRGFRVTVAPLAVAASGQATLSGLANGKTFSYELSGVSTVENQLGEDFGEQGLSANDGATDIVLTMPALLNATVSLTIWGYRV